MTSFMQSLFSHAGRIPGPGVPLLGDLPTAAKWAAENPDKLPMHRTLELHEKFGSVYSFNVGSASFVVVSDPELIRRVLTHEDFQEHINLPFLKKFGARRGIFMAEPATWKHHRRFSHRILRDLGFGKAAMQDRIAEEAECLVQRIRAACDSPVPTQQTLAKAVSNVINQLVFGKRFGYDEPDFEVYLEHTRKVTTISLTLVFLPMMLPWLESTPSLMRRLPGSNEYGEGYAFVKNFCMRELRAHKEAIDSGEEKRDFIGLFLKEQRRLADESAPELEFFGDEDLCDIVADFFIAGTDTTSVALTWAMLLLAQRQDVQDKLRAELLPVRVEDLWQSQHLLHFTRAFWDEVFRYCVLVPLNMRHASGAAKLGEFTVQPDTVVAANNYAITRNPRLFPNPDAFDPGRFLDADGCYARSPAMEGIVFGLGKRACMGESLARMETLIFLGAVVQNFQLEVPLAERPRLKAVMTGIDGAVHQPLLHTLLFTPLPNDS